MGRLFSLDGKIAVFMGKMADLVVLNLLWLLCCLPIVTIGAATTALYYVTLKMARNEESYIVKSFFYSFRENFKQSTIIWMGVVLCGNLLYFNFYFSSHIDSAAAKWMFVPFFLITVLIIITCCYVFPVLACFDNSIKKTVKNALLMAIAHFPQTVMIVLCNLLPVLIVLLLPGKLFLSLFIVCVIGVALAAWINSIILVRLFEKYIPHNVKVVKEREEERYQTGI